MSGVIDLGRVVRGGRPNDRLVAPPGFSGRATPDATAPVFPVAPDHLMAAIAEVAAGEPRTREVGRSADGLLRQYVQRSRVLRFPDDITVQVYPSGGGSTLAIWSRSRYGYSDFGVNRARVDRWLAAIRGRVAGAPRCHDDEAGGQSTP